MPAGATVDTAVAIAYTDLAIGSHTNQWFTVSSVLHPFTPEQIGTTLKISGGTGFTVRRYIIEAVDYSGKATLSALVGAYGSSGGTGTASIYTTIATGDYDAIARVAAYACANPHTNILFPSGVYYLEKYRIDAGAAKNSVTDINWLNCRDVTISGYGAEISSNGSFRRLADKGASSYENTVSPFRLSNVSNFYILGIEIYGNVDKMTKASVSEGQDYGIVSGGSRHLTLRDINVHGWPTDGVIVGLLHAPDYLSDQVVELDHVWSHNNGRMGLTLANVNKFDAVDYQCSEIGGGFVGLYLGHSPEDCVDIEPPIGDDVPIANIRFSGGYMGSAFGGLFASTTNCCDDLLIEGMVFDNNLPLNRGGGNFGLPSAKRTIIRDNTIYAQKGQGIGCGPSTTFNASWERTDIINNNFIMPDIPEISCGAADNRVHPVHFIGNHIKVTGTAVTPNNGAINLDHIQEVAFNDFFISKNARFAGVVNVINYTGTESVHDNIYSTDLTNAATPYAANYTNVRYWRNERSLNPVYFAVPSNGGGGNMTFAGNLSIAAPPAPAVPTVICIGTCTGASISYKVVGVVGSGTTAASTAVTVAAGPTAFSNTSYNTIRWNYVPGIETYNIYCTSGCSTTGKLNAQPISMNYYADTVGVGDGSAAPVSATGLGTVKVDSGVQLAGATQPACDAAHRGTFGYLAGGTGVKDTVNVCVKDAADSYAWRVILIQ